MKIMAFRDSISFAGPVCYESSSSLYEYFFSRAGRAAFFYIYKLLSGYVCSDTVARLSRYDEYQRRIGRPRSRSGPARAEDPTRSRSVRREDECDPTR